MLPNLAGFESLDPAGKILGSHAWLVPWFGLSDEWNFKEILEKLRSCTQNRHKSIFYIDLRKAHEISLGV